MPTPEEIVRTRTWDPHYDDPSPPEINGQHFDDVPPSAEDDELERWIARVFIGLALLFFGIFIGRSLP